ncbi:hypothetical protein CHS0354_024146 [Potamilus streckersoni]|uniref:Uncharacterized protein n=1 Tax=Potamilus streckersoni TaxID=2493646 RepID=A0AAE0RZG0_9BIVA|nr:hypothetical protein CHS0354_024146 [Potamilus streckersoni]
MRLAVNIDHFATIRNVRGENQPNLVHVVQLAEQFGVDGIVCHLREDRRHIKDADVFTLRQIVQTRLNLEVAATDEMYNIALKVMPDSVTFVPEKREELTTEGGLVFGSVKDFSSKILRLKEAGITVSAFINVEKNEVEKAVSHGFDFVELHTGGFSACKLYSHKQKVELKQIKEVALYGRESGLGVVAGHGLNYFNASLIRDVDHIEEVSIGHAIVNVGKWKEVQAIFNQHGIALAKETNSLMPDIEETELTLEGNAIKKARTMFYHCHSEEKDVIVFSDDSGLEIEALSLAPGVMSARYAMEVEGDPTLSHNSQANIKTVLKKMGGSKNRKARFRTVVGLVGYMKSKAGINGYFETTTEGIVKGNIAEYARGEKNFGYDPIFIPASFDISNSCMLNQGEGRSFAEMSLEEKNKLSHRRIAFEKAIRLINSLVSGKIRD